MKASAPPSPKPSRVQLEEENPFGLQEEVLNFVMQNVTSVVQCQDKVGQSVPFPATASTYSHALREFYQDLCLVGP